MAQEINKVAENTEAQVETPAAEVKEEQQTAAPAPANDQPEATEKVKKEHPKLDAFVAKAKKVGKVVGVAATVVGGIIIANKLGKGRGYQDGVEASNEAFNAGKNSVPVPELPDNQPEEVEAFTDAEFVEVESEPVDSES